MALLERKAQNIADTSAEVVASGCPGCQLQLGLGTKQRGLDVRVVHPVQLLAEAYRNEGKQEFSLDRQPNAEPIEEIVVIG